MEDKDRGKVTYRVISQKTSHFPIKYQNKKSKVQFSCLEVVDFP
jgi:hypothetical protein